MVLLQNQDRVYENRLLVLFGHFFYLLTTTVGGNEKKTQFTGQPNIVTLES